MTLLLSNILPSDHNSDLPLPKCQLIYAILTQVSIHVAQLISDAIYQFARITPPRHLVDPEKVQQSVRISSLDHRSLPVLWGVGYTHKAHPASH